MENSEPRLHRVMRGLFFVYGTDGQRVGARARHHALLP
jgi:hypothetical protein